MGVEENEISQKSNGGTELMLRALRDRIEPELLEQVQIIPSRVRELDPSKIRILWLHDLPGDPESEKVLVDGGYHRFHKLVFVSNWQMQAYIQRYNIPWSKCVVVQNAIVPIDPVEKAKDKIRIFYHSTPHRGLAILAPVFAKLCEKHDDLQLDVYSSFGLYGWQDRDKPYEPLFEELKKTRP